VRQVYSIEEGKAAVRIARSTIESNLGKKASAPPKDPDSFKAKSGLFVTLMTYPDKGLRGCIGYSEPIMSISEALREIAVASATRDPRFPRVRKEEMEKLVVDVTLLTPPAQIEYRDPEDLKGQIMIGRDGLIAERGGYSGLLLPQVPVEYGWGVEEFLSHTCMKAGLGPDEWRKGEVRFRKFSGQVFGEASPGGEVSEMPLS
jgi:uncharacterized protein (TIGR00296 family)